jgi:hypothetical protein
VNSRDDFDDLDALRVPPEAAATVKSSGNVRRHTRQRLSGNFYLCPIEWAHRALTAVGSKEQLIIALRLYRCWRLQTPGQTAMVASNAALRGPGFSREKKRRAIQRLEAAGLVEVLEHHAGRSPRIRIIE